MLIWCRMVNVSFHFPCAGFSPLYDEVVLLCLDLEEIDAAIAVVAEMETNGIKVPDETLDKVLASKKSGNSALPQPTEEQYVWTGEPFPSPRLI